jgi:antitoxin VapB
VATVAKLLMIGGSQAVRLPEDFRFPGTEVLIERDGDKVVLMARSASWDEFFGRPSAVPADYLNDRQDLPTQDRRLS